MMRKMLKRVLSVFLCILMAMTVSVTQAFAGETDSVDNAGQLTTGDTFTMGLYPQSQVTDADTLSSLNGISCEMTSYDYVKNVDSGEHTYDTVSMSYADIALSGKAYRKVTFSEYRPRFGSGDGTAENSCQDENGYTTGTYYFLWEPIVWQVLANESDGVYVISQAILDAPYYNKYSEAVTWETSSLRSWLNDDFYSFAFSGSEQEKINSITHSNEASPFDSTISGGNDTTDSLWILSVSEAKKSAYGFSDSDDAHTSRINPGTAYAKCQGLYCSSEYANGSAWWLRNPGAHDYAACSTRTDGSLYGSNSAYLSQAGVRPVYKLSSTAELTGSDSSICRIVGHDYAAGTVVSPTCVAGGYTVYTCSRCSATENRDETEPTGIHTYGDPTWSWSGDHFSATATFGCIYCEHEESVDAEVAYDVIDANVVFTASARFNDTSYSDQTSAAIPDDPIFIIRQPVSASAEPGEVATVRVIALGEDLKYQWYLKNKGKDAWGKSSIKTDTYAVTMTDARDGRELKCVIKDKYGNKVTTETAFIRYSYPDDYQPPVITVQPLSADAEPGEVATVTVSADGVGLKYQWYLKNKGSSCWSKSSIKTDTYSVSMTKARDGRELKCVVTDKYGNKATSETAFIRYSYPVDYELPAITAQPSDATAKLGKTATVHLTATGTGLTYQWYLKNKGSSTWNKSSIKTDTYSVSMTKARDGRELKCVVTDKYGNSVTSETAFIRIG